MNFVIINLCSSSTSTSLFQSMKSNTFITDRYQRNPKFFDALKLLRIGNIDEQQRLLNHPEFLKKISYKNFFKKDTCIHYKKHSHPFSFFFFFWDKRQIDAYSFSEFTSFLASDWYMYRCISRPICWLISSLTKYFFNFFNCKNQNNLIGDNIFKEIFIYS